MKRCRKNSSKLIPINFITNIDKSVRMKTRDDKRTLNHSVQYSSHLEELSPMNQAKGPKLNIFSMSDKDTNNTTEDTSKYYSTSINFNKINEGKKKVLKSFNLVTVNKPKSVKRPVGRTANVSTRHSPRVTTGFNFDKTLAPNKLPFGKAPKENNSLFIKIGNMRPNNFSDFRKNLNTSHQMRTASNSPNYHNVTLSPNFNATIRQKKKWFGGKSSFQAHEPIKSIYTPNTSFGRSRAKARMNTSVDHKVPVRGRLKNNLVGTKKVMIPSSMKVSPCQINTKFSNYVKKFEDYKRRFHK